MISKSGNTSKVALVKYLRAPAKVLNRFTRLKISPQWSKRVRETASRTVGITAGVMLSLVIPIPSSGSRHLGRPAISPHTVTGLPAWRQAFTTW